MKPQVDPEHYARRRYDSRERFMSYWHQADQILRREPEQLLEIGIGNGFLCRYLRSKDCHVHTLDFDERLEPDTVGSVLEMPFDDGAFDLVACYETLEHLPWESFAPALREMKRVARRWVLISLPDVTPYLRVDIEAPQLRERGKRRVRKFRELPYPRPEEHRFDGEHYWEVGKAGFPPSRIEGELAAAGLELEEQLRVFELPYHHFYSCRR